MALGIALWGLWAGADHTLQHSFVRLPVGFYQWLKVMVRSILLEPTGGRLGLAGVYLLVGDVGRLGSSSFSAVYLLCDLGQLIHLLFTFSEP